MALLPAPASPYAMFSSCAVLGVTRAQFMSETQGAPVPATCVLSLVGQLRPPARVTSIQPRPPAPIPLKALNASVAALAFQASASAAQIPSAAQSETVATAGRIA